MQNENLQQGGTPQKRTITDGAASVITRAEALAYELILLRDFVMVKLP